MSSAEAISEICSRLGISQSQLARSLGVTVQTVNRWAKGHIVPSEKHQQLLKAVRELCMQNDVNVQELRSILVGLGAGAAIGLGASVGLVSTAGLAAIGGLLGTGPLGLGALLAGAVGLGTVEIAKRLVRRNEGEKKENDQ